MFSDDYFQLLHLLKGKFIHQFCDPTAFSSRSGFCLPGLRITRHQEHSRDESCSARGDSNLVLRSRFEIFLLDEELLVIHLVQNHQMNSLLLNFLPNPYE